MRIGVGMPIEEVDAGQIPRYADIRAFALQAEAAGFDTLWPYDHMLFRFPDQPTRGIWEIWTLLAALSEATTRIDIGVLVLCTPFRNPALTAKMAATLDEISGGRFTLGLGAGWHKPEFDAFGYPFDHRVDRFEEALQIIAPLLREGRVTFQGRYATAIDCEIRPRGPSPAGPPILIAGSGPRMLRLTARYADSWNVAWLGQPAALATPLAALHAACAAEGRDPATLAVTAGVMVAYPSPAKHAAVAAQPEKFLVGSAAEIAAAFHTYAALGVAELICAIDPINAGTLERLTEALRIYRG
jgi:probable F420-dependent oxidoreductase